ncbi:MAG: hypothetical protein RLY93_20650 [Sumerlaeia bacterium]
MQAAVAATAAPRHHQPFRAASFLEAVERGETEDQLIRRLEPLLDSIVRRCRWQRHEDDCKQAARVKLLSAIRNGAFDSSRCRRPGNFFYTVARNAMVNVIESDARRNFDGVDDMETLDALASADGATPMLASQASAFDSVAAEEEFASLLAVKFPNVQNGSIRAACEWLAQRPHLMEGGRLDAGVNKALRERYNLTERQVRNAAAVVTATWRLQLIEEREQMPDARVTVDLFFDASLVPQVAALADKCGCPPGFLEKFLVAFGGLTIRVPSRQAVETARRDLDITLAVREWQHGEITEDELALECSRQGRTFDDGLQTAARCEAILAGEGPTEAEAGANDEEPLGGTVGTQTSLFE